MSVQPSNTHARRQLDICTQLADKSVTFNLTKSMALEGHFPPTGGERLCKGTQHTFVLTHSTCKTRDGVLAQ